MINIHAAGNELLDLREKMLILGRHANWKANQVRRVTYIDNYVSFCSILRIDAHRATLFAENAKNTYISVWTTIRGKKTLHMPIVLQRMVRYVH